jgi:hypothetical protein
MIGGVSGTVGLVETAGHAGWVSLARVLVAENLQSGPIVMAGDRWERHFIKPDGSTAR